LSAKGYVCLLPKYKCRRVWSDRIKIIELPLFPAYLFCQFDVNNRLPILMTPGMIHIVGTQKNPVPVADAEIAALQALGRSALPSQPWPFLEVGDAVRVNYGPLRGVEGILLHLKRHHKIVLSVSLLQRSVAVEIDSAWVSFLQRGPRPIMQKAALGSRARPAKAS
jgi:transcription antitermination factor NusG